MVHAKATTRAFIEYEKFAKPPPPSVARRNYLYPVSKSLLVPDLVIFLVNTEASFKAHYACLLLGWEDTFFQDERICLLE